MPHRDEGVLSAMVHRRGSNASLATVANRHGLRRGNLRAENRLRAWIGIVTLDHGRGTGMALASELADLGLPPTGELPSPS
jgi:hypothetical protein